MPAEYNPYLFILVLMIAAVIVGLIIFLPRLLAVLWDWLQLY